MALKRYMVSKQRVRSSLAVPSYGAMALKLPGLLEYEHEQRLAVPSYGAMALKRMCTRCLFRYFNLAVPSYGAMALKLQGYLAKDIP